MVDCVRWSSQLCSTFSVRGYPTTCALISLSAEDPLRLAKVLKKAWMEGGIKRGLVGTVFVLEEKVQIACEGPVERLGGGGRSAGGYTL